MNNKQSGGEDEDRKMRKLFVDKLNASITEDDILRVFSKHGDIEEVAKYQDRRAPHRYFAFVVYKYAKDCEKATRNPCPVIKGRKCNCMLAAIGKQFSGYKFFVQKGLLTEDQKEKEAALEKQQKEQQQHSNNNNNNNNNNKHNNNHNNNNHHNHNNSNHKKKPRQRRHKNKNRDKKNNEHHHQNKDQHQNKNQQSQSTPYINVNIPTLPSYRDESLSMIMNNSSLEDNSPTNFENHPSWHSQFDSNNTGSTIASNNNPDRNQQQQQQQQQLPSYNRESQSLRINRPQQQQQQYSAQYHQQQPQQQQQQQQQQQLPRYNAPNSYHNHTRREYISQTHHVPHDQGFTDRYHSYQTNMNSPYQQQQRQQPSSPFPQQRQYQPSYPSYQSYRISVPSNVPSIQSMQHSAGYYQQQQQPQQPVTPLSAGYHQQRRQRTQSMGHYYPPQQQQQRSPYTPNTPNTPSMHQQQSSPYPQQRAYSHSIPYSQMHPTTPNRQKLAHSLSPQPTQLQQPSLINQPPPIPAMTHSVSYGHIERSRSYSSGHSDHNNQPPLQQQSAPKLPGLGNNNNNNITPTPQLSNIPKTNPNPTMNRSQSARSSQSRHSVLSISQHSSLEMMAQSIHPEINHIIPSPELLADNFVEIGLTPSPPPIPPLLLNNAAKPSIDIDLQENIDLIQLPVFKTVEDAKKASDQELEAGFTMLQSPTASVRTEYNDSDELNNNNLELNE